MNIVESIALRGATEPTGREWDVVLIRGGLNKAKSRFYTAEALDDMVALANTEGLQCMANHMSSLEAKHRPEGDINNVVGWYTNVRREGDSVVGTLNMLTEGAPYPHLPKAMLEAHLRGNTDLFQLSIRAAATPKRGTVEGRKVDIIQRIDRLASTDMVTRGGAGGAVINLIASNREDAIGDIKMDWKEALKDVPTEELEEALAAIHPSILEKRQVDEPVPHEDEGAKSQEVSEAREVLAEIKRERFVNDALAKVGKEASELPEVVQSRLRKQVEQGSFDTVESLAEAINEEKTIYASVRSEIKSGLPRMRELVVEGADQVDHKQGLYESMVKMIGRKVYTGKVADPYPNVRAFNTIKEAFWNWSEVNGKSLNTNLFGGLDYAYQIMSAAQTPYDPMTFSPDLNEAMAGNSFNIQESIVSTTFSTLLGAAMHKVFIDAYASLRDKYGDWRRVVSDFVTVGDFKAHNFTRRGVYNSLPSVAQSGTYQPLTSPGEENVSLTVVKYGGTEDYSLESIANDDLNALQSIPRDLALAAEIGRYRAVFDLLVGTGATMDYDTTALFDATHNNTGTTALSSDQLHADAMAMMQQNALSASEADLFITPKYLIVPVNLNRIAWQMFRGDRELEPGTGGVMNNNPVAGMAEPITVPYWTDTNNWVLMADPTEANTIAFATLQGHEEPQIIFQDDKAVGSVFTADKITIKVRDIRDQDVLDHRSFYGEIVA